MSDRRAAWVAMAALALSLGGAPLRAQDSAGALRQRLDSLLPLEQRLTDQIQAAMQPPPGPGDTVRAGPLLAVLSGWRGGRPDRSREEALQWGLDSAWRILRSGLGPNAPALATIRLEAQTPDSSGRGLMLRAAYRPGHPWKSASWSVTPDRDDLPQRIVLLLGQAYWSLADSVLTAWLSPSEFAIGLLRPARFDAERAHVELVTAPSRAVQGCQAGKDPDCMLALGLAATDDPLRLLYNPDERVLLARQRFPEASCVGDRLAACDSLLVSAGHLLPLTGDSRRFLLRVALDQGGEGALGRLAASGGALAARLSEAAGISADSLAGAWRGRAAAARPQPVNAPARTALASLCWAGLFGLLALRSSRWR